MDDRETFVIEDFPDLLAGVDGPAALLIEFEIGGPVAEGGSTLAESFVAESKIVMRVGVSGDEADGSAISGDGFGKALQFIEHIAEIEEGEGVFGIGLSCAAV